METAGNPESLSNGKRHSSWLRVLRPLLWWVLLVLVMFGYRTHQRLAEQTHLDFSVNLGEQPLEFGASPTLDGQPVASGERVPLGHHRLAVSHPKGDSYSTNLFIWYGEQRLGKINLKRSRGILSVSAKPPAGLITIQGPEFALRLTNSVGVTTNVPTDSYTVEVSYAHWRETRETTVQVASPGTCVFVPRLGTVELSCNHPGASFQVFKEDGQLLEAGELPARLLDVPEGRYNLVAWHHKNKKGQALAVTAATTNSAEIEFLYGAAQLETELRGATVMTADGHEWGVTPLLFSELPIGRWQFQLRLSGYSPVSAALDVAADQTNIFSTNLLSINYVPAMNAARQHLLAGDYDAAFRAADEALQVKPNDPEGIALQREAVGRRHLRLAESLGKKGDFMGADKELETALQWLPDNEEVKQLLSDFKKREPEQIERLRAERSEKPKRVFDAVADQISGADSFERHELATSKPAGEVQSAILAQLKSAQPPFQDIHSDQPTSETFSFEARQAFSGGTRRCVIAGGQSKNDETRIFFKVIEFKKVAFYDQPIGALVGADSAKYTLINPYQSQSNEKVKAQIADGVRIVTECIRQAIGEESKK